MIPAYNGETDLPGCVRRLHAHLTRTFPYTFRITVVDNASTTAPWPSRTSWPASCRGSGWCVYRRGARTVADLKGVARVLGGLASGRIPVDRIRARLGRVHSPPEQAQVGTVSTGTPSS